MSHLLFGFRDLVNSNPNNSAFDLSSFFFDDSYLKALSPKRYNFYVKFVSGLSNFLPCQYKVNGFVIP